MADEIIPVFRAFQTVDGDYGNGAGNGQTVATGGTTTLAWDYWENGDETIFEEVIPGSNITSVKVLKPGIVGIRCNLIYFDSFAAKCTIGHRCLGYGAWPASSAASEYDGTAGHAGGLNHHDERVLLPPDLANLHALVGADDTPYEGASPHVGLFEFLAIQESAINRLTSFGTEMHLTWRPFRSELVELAPGAQPGDPDTPTEGIAFAFDSTTFGTPTWTRVDV